MGEILKRAKAIMNNLSHKGRGEIYHQQDFFDTSSFC